MEMTTVVLLADAPVEGVACQDLVADTALTPADGLAIYEALVADTLATMERSTIDMVVNYQPAEAVPDEADGPDPETRLREIAGSVMTPDRFEDLRFEPQVGSDDSAVVGNAITHLVRDEGVQSAAMLRPCLPRVTRSILDEGALKLRRSDVVLGPAPDGEIYYAGFGELIDFESVLEDRPIETITMRAAADDLDVDFLRNRALVSDARTFASAVARINADALAGKPVPEHFWETLQDREIEVGDDGIRSAGSD